MWPVEAKRPPAWYEQPQLIPWKHCTIKYISLRLKQHRTTTTVITAERMTSCVTESGRNTTNPDITSKLWHVRTKHFQALIYPSKTAFRVAKRDHKDSTPDPTYCTCTLITSSGYSVYKLCLTRPKVSSAPSIGPGQSFLKTSYEWREVTRALPTPPWQLSLPHAQRTLKPWTSIKRLSYCKWIVK